MKMPCEISVWNVLPVIRRELASTLIEKYGMSQAEVARRFGLTEAAISQYMKKKRGSLDVDEKAFKKQIKMSAEVIHDDISFEKLANEVCILCNLIRSSSCWEGICIQSAKKDEDSKKR